METTNASSIWSDISEHDDLWQHSTSKSNINTPHCIICPSGNIVSVVQMTDGCDMWWGGGASLYLPLSPGLINGQQAAQSINTVWHGNTWVTYCNLLLWKLKYNTLRIRSRLDQPLDGHPLKKCRNKIIIIIIIIIIFIYCNWVVTRWQWLFYVYTKYEVGYY